jgi:RING/Ubox like zinc-binding domain
MKASLGNNEIETNSGNGLHTQSPETCGVDGCSGVPMTIFPCDCELVICADCFKQGVRPKGDSPCPACQHPYKLGQMRPRRMVPKVVSWEDLMDPETQCHMSNMSTYDSDRNVKDSRWQRENGEARVRNSHGDQGEDDDVYDSDDDDDDDDQRKKRRPLSKQMSIPIVMLSIYRYILFPKNILANK